MDQSLWQKPLAQPERHDADSAARGISAPDFPIVITAMPINAAQSRVALAVMMLILLVELASAPFANLAAVRIDSFIPTIQTAMSILHLITAVLLFSQYSVRPRIAMLAVASGYVFSALFAFEQTLAFPGAYSAGGLIGDGNDTAVWLFVLWQTTFPLAVIIYALTKDASEAPPTQSPRRPMVVIGITVASIATSIIGLTWLTLVSAAYLPEIYVTATQVSTAATYLVIYLLLLNTLALALLFFRRRTILDLWLIVTLFAWWPTFVLPIYFTVIRFSVGWYVGRFLATLASSAVLFVLLAETTMLYARLAGSIRLLRRERRERLTSVEAATAAMAHEIRQPLTGITLASDLGPNSLNATPPDIQRARECFRLITRAALRVEETINSIRDLFRKDVSRRGSVQFNDVCYDVVKLLGQDLLANEISVMAEYQQDLPQIHADQLQLQQVVMNLITNAIDAMKVPAPTKRRLWLTTGLKNNSMVCLFVRDSGSGVPAGNQERIFDPFYTTKLSGTGLGLAICRKIIEGHGGTLRLAETSSQGSVFEIDLPIGVAETVRAEATPYEKELVHL